MLYPLSYEGVDATPLHVGPMNLVLSVQAQASRRLHSARPLLDPSFAGY